MRMVQGQMGLVLADHPASSEMSVAITESRLARKRFEGLGMIGLVTVAWESGANSELPW